MRGQEEGDDEDIVGMTGLCTSLRSRKNWQSFHTTKTTRIRRPEMKDMITGIRILSTNTILVILLVLMIIHATCAQNDGVFGQTVCACTPRSYQFTFILNNETSSCLNNKIVGDGVITTECSIAPFQNTTTPITDLVPVAIDTIDILELDKDLVFIAQASKFGTYGNNDTFEYTSITSNLTSFNVSTTPKALQLSMLGKNTAGNDIFFQILIIFSTNCSTYPIIQPGTQLGWITLTQATSPYVEVCPLASTDPLPVATPSSGITAAPVGMPSATMSPVLGTPSTAQPAIPLGPTLLPVTVLPRPVYITPSPSVVRSTKVPSDTKSTNVPTLISSKKSSKPPQPSATSAKTPTSDDRNGRSSKTPSGGDGNGRSSKTPTISGTPIHSATPTQSSSPLCPRSSGDGKGKKKGKSQKGKGKGMAIIGLEGNWSDTLFEGYDECKSSKEKKSPKDKKSPKSGEKKGDTKGKGKGKGKGNYYGNDDYYNRFDTDAPSSNPMNQSKPDAPTTAGPVISPSNMPIQTTTSSLKGQPTIVPNGNTTNDTLTRSDDIGNAYDSKPWTGSGSDSDSEEYNSNSVVGGTSRAARSFMMVGTIVGACIFTFGIALFGRQQYQYQRKLRTEKALNIMKGLIKK